MPDLLEAIAHILSQPDSSDIRAVITHGLEHGSLRAQQGYDAEEIAREYGILRTTIFDALETDFLAATTQPVLRTTRLVNASIDKAIALCMKRYTDERIETMNLLHDELLVSNQELDWLVRNERTKPISACPRAKKPAKQHYWLFRSVLTAAGTNVGDAHRSTLSGCSQAGDDC